MITVKMIMNGIKSLVTCFHKMDVDMLGTLTTVTMLQNVLTSCSVTRGNGHQKLQLKPSICHYRKSSLDSILAYVFTTTILGADLS